MHLGMSEPARFSKQDSSKWYAPNLGHTTGICPSVRRICNSHNHIASYCAPDWWYRLVLVIHTQFKKNKSPSYIIFKAILYISQWKRKLLHLLCKQNGTWVTFLQQQLPSKGNYSPSRAWTDCFSQKEETLSMTQYVWKALSVSLEPWHMWN